MPVPSAYNDITPLKRVRDHLGWVWYETYIVCPETEWTHDDFYREQTSSNSVHLLRFDSVNYETIVWLNGVKLGTHIGGHLPFSFKLTNRDLCDSRNSNSIGPRKGNRLSIAVNNNLTVNTIPSGYSRQIKLSNGKLVNRFRPDFDFFNYAGILRDVRLYTVPDMFISDITTNVKEILYDQQDRKDEEDLLKLFDNANKSISTVYHPTKAIVSYKLKVDVPDRVLARTKSFLMSADRDMDRATNLSIFVSLRDDSGKLVAETIKHFNISHEYIVTSQNELLRYNKRYFELEGDIVINDPKLWLPYQASQRTNTTACITTCNVDGSIEQEQSTSDRLNYRAHLYDLEFAMASSYSHHHDNNHTIRAKDVYNLKIGIKRVELSTENGPFVINKRPVYLRGFGKHEEQLVSDNKMVIVFLTTKTTANNDDKNNYFQLYC